MLIESVLSFLLVSLTLSINIVVISKFPLLAEEGKGNFLPWTKKIFYEEKKKKTTHDETANLLFWQKHPFRNPRALTSAHFGFSEKKEVWKTEVKIFTPPHLTSAHFDTIFFLQERKTPQLLRDEKFTNLFFVPIAKSLVGAIFRFVPPSFLFKKGKSRVNSLISPKSLNIFRYVIYIYIYIYIYTYIYILRI